MLPFRHMRRVFAGTQILQMEIAGSRALPLPAQVIRSSGWRARLARVGGSPLQQRGLGLLQRQQAFAQIAGHSRLRQRITQGGRRKQPKQQAQDQGQQQDYATLTIHEAGTGLRIATLSSWCCSSSSVGS